MYMFCIYIQKLHNLFDYQSPSLYYMYKEAWEALHCQILQCVRESSNRYSLAVSIANDTENVGHLVNSCGL